MVRRPAALAAACLALAAAGCSTVIEGSVTTNAPTIAAVAVMGNNQVEEDDIIGGLANKPPERDMLFLRKVYRRLDRLALEQDISRIEAYYHRRGFYSAKVIGTDIQPDGDNRVRVTFRVSEGQPTRVSGIVVLGLSGGLQRSALLTDKLKDFRRGSVFRHDKYVEFKDWIAQQWLAERGFPHGVVSGEVDVDRDSHTANMVLRVDRGPYARFRKTIIRGLRRVPESAVRNRLVWKQGDSLRLTKLQQTQGRLYQLGLFSSVRTDFERRGRPKRTDIYINLAEARRHELRLGGGITVSGQGFDPDSLRIEVHQRTAYLMRGVITPLSTLRLEARPGWEWWQDGGTTKSRPVGEATATIERPDLFIPLMVGQATVGYEQSQLSEYVLRGPLVRLGLTRPFLENDRLQVGLAWRFRRLDFDELDPALDGTSPGPDDTEVNSPAEQMTRVQIGLEEPYRLGVLEQNIVYDWRNDPLDPRWGAYGAVTVSEGAAAFGSALPFARGTVDLRGYVPILRVFGFRDRRRRLVLAGRAFYGRVLGGNPLPITERFYDGGASGHRGFTFQRLSPQVIEDTGAEMKSTARIGGEEHFLSSAEARIDIADIKTYPFGVVLFTDAGDVVAETGDLDFKNLHYAAGFGVRWSPVVSIRLDFGYRLNRYDDGEPDAGNRFAFHFSLGQAF